eukprot:6931855-Alexandrium_andersonii.AAC.1
MSRLCGHGRVLRSVAAHKHGPVHDRTPKAAPAPACFILGGETLVNLSGRFLWSLVVVVELSLIHISEPTRLALI